MSAEELTGLLAEHAFHCVVSHEWWAECLAADCDWSENGDSDLRQAEAAHRAHVADLLAARDSQREAGLRERAESAEAMFTAVSNATAAEAHELGWREAIDVLGYVLADGPDWGPSQVVSDAMVYVASHPTDPYNRARGEGQ